MTPKAKPDVAEAPDGAGADAGPDRAAGGMASPDPAAACVPQAAPASVRPATARRRTAIPSRTDDREARREPSKGRRIGGRAGLRTV